MFVFDFASYTELQGISEHRNTGYVYQTENI